MYHLETIKQFRQSSREMVRALGLLADESPFNLALSFRHALIEIDVQGPLNQIDLTRLLDLNKSTVSRIIKKLVKFNLVEISTSNKDLRYKLISLTVSGKQLVSKMHESSNAQVRNAFEQLSDVEQKIVIQGITLYAEALKISNNQDKQAQIKPRK